MKKIIFFVIFALFLSTPALTAGNLKLLNIDIPKDKNKLYFSLDDLQKIIDEMDVEKEDMAVIRFTDFSGIVLAELGKMKKGKIKWNFKVQDNKFLKVKFKKDVYAIVAEKVKAKSTNPGFQLQVIPMVFDIKSTHGKIKQSFERSGKYDENFDAMKICEVTFGKTMDLTAALEYPIEVSPGDEMGGRVTITIENKGTNPAGEFTVELVLSSDDKIPMQTGTYSDTFVEDMLLQGGRQKVESLNPGESKSLKLEGPLKIPADTPPGRFYLGVVVDTENKVEETAEDNNVFSKFIMISFPAPKSVTLEMPGMELVYRPKTFDVKVMCQGVEFSDGRDWRKCQIRSYIHQLKQVGWPEKFHWEVDTQDRGVWRIKDAVFCKRGGVGEEAKLKMQVSGGSKTVPPSKVVLNLSDARLRYEIASGKLELKTAGDQIAYIPFWNVARIQAHIYQFKYNTWQDFFWEVDTFKKEVKKITGGFFGKEGGTQTPIPLTVTVED